MKVRIESSNEDNQYRSIEITKVYVDGVLIGTGTYGGEPEDNSRCRDYHWVEKLLFELAKQLGAEVELRDHIYD